MEVFFCLCPLMLGVFVADIADIHLRKISVKLPSKINHLSVEQYYEKYSNPETVRQDGNPLPPSMPPRAVISLYLGIKAEDFKLHDAHILLSDFCETFSPSSSSSDIRRGGDTSLTKMEVR